MAHQWDLLRIYPLGHQHKIKPQLYGIPELEKAVPLQELSAEERVSRRKPVLEKTMPLQVSPGESTIGRSPALQKLHTGDTGRGWEVSAQRMSW